MLPQRKKETTVRPQCNIFPVFTYKKGTKHWTPNKFSKHLILDNGIYAGSTNKMTSLHQETHHLILKAPQYFGVQFGVCFSVVWGLLGYHVGRGYNFIYFYVGFTALHVSNELHAHNLFSCLMMCICLVHFPSISHL